MITTEEIKRKLWEGANDLRGSMDASKYKDYMLGLMFYKFLSDKTLEEFRKLLELSKTDNLLEEYKAAYEEDKDLVVSTLQDVLGYYVLPQHLYQQWLLDIKTGNFELQKIVDGLNDFERRIANTDGANDFSNLFSFDLTNSALGGDLKKRSKNISDLILLFSDLNMIELQAGDVLGDAYEYLIAQFASNAGKKAGEFYTPHQVSEVMAQIVAKTTDRITSIYDPTVGSGSLLLTVRKHLSKDEQDELYYYGQEFITETYNLTRMNLLLHGVKPEKMNIKNGNTLAQDWPEDPGRPNEGVQFDAVVMNPPYSDKKWNGREERPLKVSDPRFADFGVLPPDSKGDFAYLMHGLFHLGQQGTMAIVLPHGVLFRGGAEGEIRKRLLEKNYLDAIIGLPSNLFTNTGIPVCVLILKKNRQMQDPVLVIDASNDFIKVGKQNVLREKDTAKIVDTYINKQSIEGYSHLATRSEIKENDFNMNISRYVKVIDEEIAHDVDGHIYGGIPTKNVDDLHVLNDTVNDILRNSLSEVRTGYVTLNKSIVDLTNEVLNADATKGRLAQIKDCVKAYTDEYFNILRSVDIDTDVRELKENMLVAIYKLIAEVEHIDAYSAYQVIAELWRDSLTHDVELISSLGFYEAGRTREPNMVTKGSGDKKRLEQDGWNGAIVPNDLIAKRLFTSELDDIESKKSLLEEIESELLEIVESAKVEDSEEFNLLNDLLKRNKEDEVQDAFDDKSVKAALKNVSKGSSEHEQLQKISKLLTEKSTLTKKIKIEEGELKEAIYSRIGQLTDDEIDALVHEKWFASLENQLANLVEEPLKKELATLEKLATRYQNTLNDLDKKANDLENTFDDLMSELVVG